MQIDTYNVYDIFSSMVASGFPMLSHYDQTNFYAGLTYMRSDNQIKSNAHYKRAVKLAKTKAGTGHDNFLAGITVSANVTASQVWWMQFERYHFAQIVSSMSKMHRIREILGDKACKGKTDEQLIYECPMSLELTARIVTNYRQLKTIYVQRHNHKLKEWRDFCEWIEKLPYADDLILP